MGIAPVLVAAVVAMMLVTVACGNRDESGREAPAADPLPFLAERPALPSEWLVEGSPRVESGPRRIVWRGTARGGRVSVRWCEGESVAFREWTEGGIPHTYPTVDQSVCVFGDEDRATAAYESLSLRDVAGEDWPNFDSPPETESTPANTSELEGLAADSWEIGCGLGDPEDVCAVWLFRSRYGRVLADVEFSTSGGGITFSAMRELVQSIDRHMCHASLAPLAPGCPASS